MSSNGSASFRQTPSIRTTSSGGTGYQIWNSARILEGVLLALDTDAQEVERLASPEQTSLSAEAIPANCDDKLKSLHERCSFFSRFRLPKPGMGCTLELGAGTGHLAVSLALAGWRGILATDGEAAVVRNMKFNVQANRVGHAVRCLKWDWADDLPKGLDLADVDLVIGSDLVYYKRTHGMLAAVLHRILTARSPDDPRPPAQAFLLCCIRHAYEDGAGQVVHDLSSEAYAGSSMQRFIEKELPDNALNACHLPIPEHIFDKVSNEPGSQALELPANRQAYCLYKVELDESAPG